MADGGGSRRVETIAASVPEVQAVDRLRLRWLLHAVRPLDAASTM